MSGVGYVEDGNAHTITQGGYRIPMDTGPRHTYASQLTDAAPSAGGYDSQLTQAPEAVGTNSGDGTEDGPSPCGGGGVAETSLGATAGAGANVRSFELQSSGGGAVDC